MSEEIISTEISNESAIKLLGNTPLPKLILIIEAIIKQNKNKEEEMNIISGHPYHELILEANDEAIEMSNICDQLLDVIQEEDISESIHVMSKIYKNDYFNYDNNDKNDKINNHFIKINENYFKFLSHLCWDWLQRGLVLQSALTLHLLPLSYPNAQEFSLWYQLYINNLHEKIIFLSKNELLKNILSTVSSISKVKRNLYHNNNNNINNNNIEKNKKSELKIQKNLKKVKKGLLNISQCLLSLRLIYQYEPIDLLNMLLASYTKWLKYFLENNKMKSEEMDSEIYAISIIFRLIDNLKRDINIIFFNYNYDTLFKSNLSIDELMNELSIIPWQYNNNENNNNNNIDENKIENNKIINNNNNIGLLYYLQKNSLKFCLSKSHPSYGFIYPESIIYDSSSISILTQVSFDLPDDNRVNKLINDWIESSQNILSKHILKLIKNRINNTITSFKLSIEILLKLFQNELNNNNNGNKNNINDNNDNINYFSNIFPSSKLFSLALMLRKTIYHEAYSIYSIQENFILSSLKLQNNTNTIPEFINLSIYRLLSGIRIYLNELIENKYNNLPDNIKNIFNNNNENENNLNDDILKEYNNINIPISIFLLISHFSYMIYILLSNNNNNNNNENEYISSSINNNKKKIFLFHNCLNNDNLNELKEKYYNLFKFSFSIWTKIILFPSTYNYIEKIKNNIFEINLNNINKNSIISKKNIDNLWKNRMGNFHDIIMKMDDDDGNTFSDSLSIPSSPSWTTLSFLSSSCSSLFALFVIDSSIISNIKYSLNNYNNNNINNNNFISNENLINLYKKDSLKIFKNNISKLFSLIFENKILSNSNNINLLVESQKQLLLIDLLFLENILIPKQLKQKNSYFSSFFQKKNLKEDLYDDKLINISKLINKIEEIFDPIDLQTCYPYIKEAVKNSLIKHNLLLYPILYTSYDADMINDNTNTNANTNTNNNFNNKVFTLLTPIPPFQLLPIPPLTISPLKKKQSANNNYTNNIDNTTSTPTKNNWLTSQNLFGFFGNN